MGLHLGSMKSHSGLVIDRVIERKTMDFPVETALPTNAQLINQDEANGY